MRLVLIVAMVTFACGCPGKNGTFTPPPQQPTAEDVIARLAKIRESRTSFRAESVMDYWLGQQRVKGTVYVMGTNQRQVRFNAISPQQDVLADMACDGTNFTFVNMQKNCQLTGPCNAQSIATLLRVELEPEDVLHLALGTVPVPAQSTGTVTWDPDKGHQVVNLTSPEGKQTIRIDTREGRFDVVSSELVGPEGKVTWSVANTDFQTIQGAKGETHRLPGKTRFRSPAQKADLLVEWKQAERAVNLELPAEKFTVNIPAGLPRCK